MTTANAPAETPEPIAKLFAAEELNGTPGERSVVAWISTDIVDREGDVVVAEGVDTRSEFMDTNPVLMAIHNLNQFPIGTFAENRGGWVKVKKTKGFTGLFAKCIFDTDPTSEEIFGKYKRQICRMFSIRFRPPNDLKPGEWGPPTDDELKVKPHWKGARAIIRRSILLETSVCPIGMNQLALAVSVSKSLPVAPEVRRMLDALPKDEPDPLPEGIPDAVPDETIVAAFTKAATEASGTDGGYTAPPEKKPKPATETEPEPIKAGDYVEWGRGQKAGCGKVVSVHKAGKVPGVDNGDLTGSEDEPAAKVKCYAKSMRADGSDRWTPTEKHMGHLCKDLSKIPHEMERDMDDDGGDMGGGEMAEKSFMFPEPVPTVPDLPMGVPWDQIEQEAVGNMANLFAESLEKAVERAWGAV